MTTCDGTMSDVQLENSINSWVCWSRDHIPAPPSSLPIKLTEEEFSSAGSQAESAPVEWHLLVPWRTAVLKLLDAVTWLPEEADVERLKFDCENYCKAFLRPAAGTKYDLAWRFTSLHFFQTALDLFLSAPEVDIALLENEAAFSKGESVLNRCLRTLVKSIPARDCPSAWRVLEWEIRNSLNVQEWGRVCMLCDSAEESGLKDTAEIEAIRGQIRFQAVLDPDRALLNALHWELHLLDSTSLFASPGVFRSVLLDPFVQTRHLSANELDEIRDARNELEKALAKKADLHPIYHAMLARCQFALGQFGEAAREYELFNLSGQHVAALRLDKVKDILVSERGFEGWFGLPEDEYVQFIKAHMDEVRADFKPQLYFSLSEASRRVGNIVKAIQYLEDWSKEYPISHLPWTQLADVNAQEGEFEAAYECLRKAAELNPDLEKQTATKIALALGALPRSAGSLASALVERWLKDHPQVSALIDSFQAEMWPTYRRIAEPARKEWRVALLNMHYFPYVEPDQKGVFLEKAAAGFSKALELELKANLFGLYKVEAKKDNRVMASAKGGEASEDAKSLCKFLLRPHSQLSLGEMKWTLERSIGSSLPILKHFHSWVVLRTPGIIGQLRNMTQILDVRNPATHESGKVSREDSIRTAALCREVLDQVARGPKPN